MRPRTRCWRRTSPRGCPWDTSSPRPPLLDAWGLRAYELYAMTEYPCFHVECPEQSGIHLWADWCIPEIIPLDALDREEADGSGPAAIHLFDAAPRALGGA